MPAPVRGLSKHVRNCPSQSVGECALDYVSRHVFTLLVLCGRATRRKVGASPRAGNRWDYPGWSGELPNLGRGLAASLDAELGQDGRDMVVDGFRGEEQALRDLAIGQAFGDHGEDLGLALGEVGAVAQRCRARAARQAPYSLPAQAPRDDGRRRAGPQHLELPQGLTKIVFID